MAPGSAAYKSSDFDESVGGEVEGRALRAQGRSTLARLREAALRTFAERGFHAARVDDVVREADTSHGTFYLYFSNKEDLLRSLAAECAREWSALTDDLGDVDAHETGRAEIRRFLSGFLGVYRRYGPVIRAWMEGHVDDREMSGLGVRSFTDIANALTRRMRDAGAPSGRAQAAALMALLDRSAYYIVSRRLDATDEAVLDTLSVVVHRGFFAPGRPR